MAGLMEQLTLQLGNQPEKIPSWSGTNWFLLISPIGAVSWSYWLLLFSFSFFKFPDFISICSLCCFFPSSSLWKRQRVTLRFLAVCSLFLGTVWITQLKLYPHSITKTSNWYMHSEAVFWGVKKTWTRETLESVSPLILLSCAFCLPKKYTIKVKKESTVTIKSMHWKLKFQFNSIQFS